MATSIPFSRHYTIPSLLRIELFAHLMNSLHAIRVLDLSRVLAGPWCTQTLADLGADVIKVERPLTGDDTRAWGPPFLRNQQGHDTSDAAYFLGTNRNKRSITLDISTPQGQQIIKDLVLSSDVFVENYKVGDMKRYGLDYATLRALKPELVYCSITGFGQTGPYKDRAGYDYAVQGMGGLMSVTGERDDLGGGPQKVGVAVADLFTGLYACIAIMAALRHAAQTGAGQYIDMALFDTQVAVLANLGANYLVDGQFTGKVPGRMGNAHQNIVPYQVFEVAPNRHGERDYMILAIGNDRQFVKFCDIAGHPEWSSDLRFSTNAARVVNRALLVPILEQCMLKRTKSEWLSALEQAQVPCGAINNLKEVFEDPHLQSRGMVHQWSHPHAPALALVNSPMKLSLTPVRYELPPPLLGEHTREILSQILNLNDSQMDDLKARHII
jgi:crotonobetainyl-CoA:carnitine CoA-transferase CaiB-like acyl-CoA transferase